MSGKNWKITMVFVAVVLLLAGVAYLVAQWRAQNPLSIRVLGVTRREGEQNTLTLELKNASPFPIRLLDAGGLELYPVSLTYEGETAVYHFGPQDPGQEKIVLKSGQAIQRELTGARDGAFDGVLGYAWEPTLVETVRRIELRLGKWRFWKPLAPLETEMRGSDSGPLSIPAPAEAAQPPP